MMRTRRAFLAAAAGIGIGTRHARADSAIPAGLPDVLRMSDGSKITTASQWQERRTELLDLFTREMYGRAPARPGRMAFRQVEAATDALGGTALREQATLSFEPAGGEGNQIHLLLYIPRNAKGPVPAILGINFWGNHTIAPDQGIHLSGNWVESGKNPFIDLSCVADHRATESCHGINARQWPVADILKRGYALVTFYRGDIDPDRADGFASSTRGLYPDLQQGDDNFSTIGAWAWALSRALDYLETDRRIDAKRVAAFGWSRLGR